MLRIILRFLNFLFENRFDGSVLEDYRLHKSQRNTRGTTKFMSHSTHYVDGRNFITCRREIFRDEVYKIPTNENLDSPIIIDCGANIGLGVIYLKSLFPKANIIAYEPDDENYDVLLKNIESHNFTKVVAHKKAVWIHDQGVEFDSKGTMDSQISPEKSKTSISIDSVKLSDVLAQFERIYFLKIDIEGAENLVVEDCRNYIDRCENIFIEYHSIYNDTQKLPQILSVLTENGFRYHIKETNTVRLPYLQKYDSGEMEFQLNIFAYKL